MAKQKKRGVVFYLSALAAILDALNLEDESTLRDIGKAFVLFHLYDQTGVLPDLSKESFLTTILFNTMKPWREMSNTAYSTTAKKARWGVYVRSTKKKERLSRPEWALEIDSVKHPEDYTSEEISTYAELCQHTSGEQNIDIDTDIDIDKDKNKKGRKRPNSFSKPTIEDIRAYCSERNNNIDPEHFFDYYEARAWKLPGNKTMSDWKAVVRTWERNSLNIGVSSTISNHTQNDYGEEGVSEW